MRPWVCILCLVISGLCCSSCGDLFRSGQLSPETLEQLDQFFTQAEIAIDMEQYDSAQDRLNQIIEIHPIGNQQEDSIDIRWHYLMGMTYFQDGLYENAREYFETARSLVNSIDTELEHQLYLNSDYTYGLLHDDRNQLGTLLDYVLKVDSAHVNSQNISHIYLRLARFYGEENNNYDQANHYLNVAEEHLTSKDTTLLFRCQQSRVVFNKELTLSERIEMFEDEIPLANGVNNSTKSFFYTRLGGLYWQANDYQKTLAASLKDLYYARGIKDSRARKLSVAEAWVNLGDAYMNLQQYSTALNYLDSAEIYSNHLGIDYYQALYWNRQEIYYRLGYPVDSLREVYYKMSNGIVGTLLEKSRMEMIALSNRENEKTLLIRSNSKLLSDKLLVQRNTTLLAVFLMMVIGYLYFKLHKRRRAINKLQNRLISNQLNPHFIGNAINSAMIIAEYEDRSTLLSYLSQLHVFIRHLFENYQSDYVSIAEELQMLSAYVAIEQDKLELDEVLVFTTTIDSSLDADQLLITPMLLQPLLENSIKYGRPGSQNHIHLSIHPLNQRLLKCVITDTGKGIEGPVTQFSDKHSLYYIKAYNDLVTKTSSLRLYPSDSGQGTSAELFIRYKTN